MRNLLRSASAAVALAAALSVTPALPQTGAITPALVQKTAQSNFREFFDMLAMQKGAATAGPFVQKADPVNSAG